LAVVPKASAPPRDPKAFGDFIDQIITCLGDHFEWIELWSEPNNPRYWDVTLDPGWLIFTVMIRGAAHWAKRRGKRTVLAGTPVIDPYWLQLVCERGIMEFFDAVGLHHRAEPSDMRWKGWPTHIAAIQQTLNSYGSPTEIWITETGCSTWRYDERGQLGRFVEALDAPVARIYWSSARDLDPNTDGEEEREGRLEEREFHYGLKQTDGSPKLLYRLWAERGPEKIKEAAWLSRPTHRKYQKKPVLITGGSGFVGTNLADRLLSEGRPVLLFDNLSRPGVERNLEWLVAKHGQLVQIEVADVRDADTLKKAVRCCSQVFHFAAQVAVTTSLTGPIKDFGINARGTLNLLEALRSQADPPPLVFTSTNKVYGGLEDLLLAKNGTRYEPADPHLRSTGISEDRPLDFHSPYGCSKGTADQYILDYARTFSLPTVVFRMSCIYGPHQFGTEDQGWVAYFLIRALQNQSITIYGDGKQVRDLLYVDDLVNAFLQVKERIEKLAGRAFNIGGSPKNTISLLELITLIGTLIGNRPFVRFADWRPGDQRYYVSDTTRFQTATNWSPQTDIQQGIEKLHRWLVSDGVLRHNCKPEVKSYEIFAHQS
jgi:CDP-paratose 2-epimerase